MPEAIDPRLQELIREFGGEIGLTNLALDADGSASLTFDGKVDVNFQLTEDGDSLVLFTDLGPAPEDDAAETYASLLRANYFWQATHGGTLSLTADESRIVMAIAVPWSNLSTVVFSERVRRFVDAAEDWMDFVRGDGDFAAAAESDGEISAFVKV